MKKNTSIGPSIQSKFANRWRLDNLILEAITTLKEPSGSDRASIALYIQEKYWAPMNLRKLLGGKLKHLTANGKLIKVKHKYRIASSSTVSEGRRNHPLPEGKQKDMLKLERSKNKILTKAQRLKQQQGKLRKQRLRRKQHKFLLKQQLRHLSTEHAIPDDMFCRWTCTLLGTKHALDLTSC
ncbi:hypothetical protein OIU76_006422 [Salix suchowensis]|nr:hypothetical protein OIU76_006422 [Salix suchowensis]